MFPAVACIFPRELGVTAIGPGGSQAFYGGSRRGHCVCQSTTDLPLTEPRDVFNSVPLRTGDLRQSPLSQWPEVAAVVLTVPESPPVRRVLPFMETCAWLNEWTPEITLFVDGGQIGVESGDVSKEQPWRTVWDSRQDGKGFEPGLWQAMRSPTTEAGLPYDLGALAPGERRPLRFRLRAAKRLGYTRASTEPLDRESPYLLWYLAINGTPVHDLLPREFANTQPVVPAPGNIPYSIYEFEECLVEAGIATGEQCRLSWHVNASLVNMTDFQTQFTPDDVTENLILFDDRAPGWAYENAVRNAPWAWWRPPVAGETPHGYAVSVKTAGGGQTPPFITITNPVITTCSLHTAINITEGRDIDGNFIQTSLKPDAPNDFVALVKYRKRTHGSRVPVGIGLGSVPLEMFFTLPAERYFAPGIGTTDLFIGRPGGNNALTSQFHSQAASESPSGVFSWLGYRGFSNQESSMFLFGVTDARVSLNWHQLVSRLAPGGKDGDTTWGIPKQPDEEAFLSDGKHRPFLWNEEGDTAPHPCKGPEVKQYIGWLASDLLNPLP